MFREARRPIVFTGAGVSTESGIPDFRSPGGVWARFDPREFTYQNFVGSLEGRRRYWQLGRATYPLIRAASPNAAHRALAELHRLGRLDCCITQNIDDLHQRAGLPAAAVIELHGNATRARCLTCELPYSRDELHAWLEDGQRRARAADLFVVLGSSLVVYPAAYLPIHAKRAGAALVIVNLEPTPLDGEADLVLRARATEVMAHVLDHVRAGLAEKG
ncbi:MAG: sigma factor regulator FecR [Candidatus Rokuibacteriota bacterium]|nr:MAG: sigma factor regulator FecR [Candidatus Rokubacteria bacterium]